MSVSSRRRRVGSALAFLWAAIGLHKVLLVVDAADADADAGTVSKDGGVSGSRGRKKKRIGLLTASLPWTFGPYQTQTHELSLLLSNNGGHADDEKDDDFDFDVCWLSFSPNAQLPPGEYRLPAPGSGRYESSELHRHLPNAVRPPDDLVLDHLTFLGGIDSARYKDIGPDRAYTSGAGINALAKQYRLDVIVTLMDIQRLIPDEAFEVPVVGWVPLHSGPPLHSAMGVRGSHDVGGVRRSSSDYWGLRHHHAVAALAPSSAVMIEEAVGSVIRFDNEDSGVTVADSSSLELAAVALGSTEVEWIPHIFDREAILASSRKGLDALAKEPSVAHADSKLSGSPPILDRGQERTLEAGHGRSLFTAARGVNEKDNTAASMSCGDRDEGPGIDDNTFVVLMQGGNYDKNDDRKGWDTSVQAFVRLYNKVHGGEYGKITMDDGSSCVGAAKVHLLIHSMESYIIESDMNRDGEAPPMVLPDGHLLHRLLHTTGLPRHTYTIDIAKHTPEIVAAYKARASICLHTSKVEGFGMNVIECQAVGTPVITTNYTAMGDYTRLGRSVVPRQMIKSPQGLHELALPDVEGITDALMELYDEHVAIRAKDAATVLRRADETEATGKWIDSAFAPQLVGSQFKSLIRRAEAEYERRTKARRKIIRDGGTPASGSYVVSKGYHQPIADWDAPWTLLAPDGLVVSNPTALHRICWEALLTSGRTNVMALSLEGGGEMTPENALLLVRTYVVQVLQMQASRRTSLVSLAINQAVMPRVLPQGLVAIVAKKGV